MAHDDHSHSEDHRAMLCAAALCGVALAVAISLEQLAVSSSIYHACYIICYVAGSWFAAGEAVENVSKGKVDIHFLMLLVAIGAFAINAHAEGGILLFLFSLSGGLEALAQHRTQQSIASLFKDFPREVLLRVGSEWKLTPLEKVARNDVLLVKPGELFPTDGIVVEGETSSDESALSGEAIPVPKVVGDRCFGGTLNQDGKCVIRVTAPSSESAVQKVLRLIDTAHKQKAPAQRLTDLVSRYYTWAALGLSALRFLYLLVIEAKGLDAALYWSMVLLVVASPCALVISIPSAVLAAIAAGARRGILFRGGIAVQNLGQIKRYALDKTGTLTTGKLTVENVYPTAPGISADEVLAYAASVSRYSTHPLSHAIVKSAESKGLSIPASTDVKNYPGKGLEAFVAGESILVGSAAFIYEKSGSTPVTQDSVHSEVYVSSSRVKGTIHLADDIRADAAATVSQLKSLGCKVSVLSGDREAAVQQIARKLQVDDFRGGVSPEEKLNAIREWQRNGESVAMTGDGINDAPALAASNIAIAMGDRASDSALEQSDVVIMGGKINRVVEAMNLSLKARRIILQNVTISLSVVALLICSTLFEGINLTTGVIGHEGSTVMVVVNSLRLLGLRSPRA